MKSRLIAPAIALTLLAAGCSTGGDAVAEPSTPVATAAAPTDPAPTPPEPSPTPTEAAPVVTPEPHLPFGQAASLSDGSTVTVHAVNMDPAPDAPAPAAQDAHWVAVDVEGCWSAQTPANSVFTNMAWALRDSENRQYQPSNVTYQQFPQPAYGFSDTPVVAGECVRGWISYEIPNGEHLAEVKYQSQAGGPFYWAVG